MVGCHEQPAGRGQTSLLKKLHGGLMERQLEHPVKMIRRQVRGFRRHRYADALSVARTKKVAATVEPAVKLRSGRRTLPGELVHFLAHVVAERGDGRECEHADAEVAASEKPQVAERRQAAWVIQVVTGYRGGVRTRGVRDGPSFACLLSRSK